MQEPHIMQVHPFMLVLTRDNDPPKLHWFRDGTALGNVLWTLAAKGYGREDDLVNRRETTWPEAFLGDAADRQLIVMGTRPPISDKRHQRKFIHRSGCEIENAILNRQLAYYSYLERGRVTLTRELSSACKRRNRTDIQFVYYGRRCTFFSDYFAEDLSERNFVRNDSMLRTYGYVMRDQLWKNGPEVLSFFGIDGEATLAFAILLRTRHPELLEGRGLSIVELKGQIPPKAGSLSFVRDWETKVILDRAATKIAPPRTREQACREAPRRGKDFIDISNNEEYLPAEASASAP